MPIRRFGCCARRARRRDRVSRSASKRSSTGAWRRRTWIGNAPPPGRRNEAQDALAVAERLSDPELRERIRLTLGEALAMGGKLQAAVDAFNAALEAVETGALRDPVFRLSALYFLGNAQEQLVDVEGAITTLNEATKLATDVLMPERLGQLYAKLAEQYQEQNDSRRARLYATHSLAAYEDADNRLLRAPDHRAPRLRVCADRGDFPGDDPARKRARARGDRPGIRARSPRRWGRWPAFT